jgi:ATPase family associated with various cellular activities (AAA)
MFFSQAWMPVILPALKKVGWFHFSAERNNNNQPTGILVGRSSPSLLLQPASKPISKTTTMNNVNLLAALQKKQQQAGGLAAAAESSSSSPAGAAAVARSIIQQHHHHHTKKPPRAEPLSSSSPFREDVTVPFEYRHELEAFVFFTKDQTAASMIAGPAAADGTSTTSTWWDETSRTITIPLAPCLYRLCDYTLNKREPIALRRTVAKLGVLRCLRREMTVFNTAYLQPQQQQQEQQEPTSSIGNSSLVLDETILAKTRFMELLSNCGVYQTVLDLILKHHHHQHDPTTSTTTSSSSSIRSLSVVIDSLDSFLAMIASHAPDLAEARALISTTGTTNFYPGLGELYVPGTKVISYPGSLYGSPLGSTVVQSWYSEESNAATHQTKRSFVLVIEFVVSVGTKLVTVAATDVYPDFPNTIGLHQLSHKILQQYEETTDGDGDGDHGDRTASSSSRSSSSSLLLLQRLHQRGAFYAQVATSPTYIYYGPASFYPNRVARPLVKSGRVMVDVQRGIANAVLPVVSTTYSSDNGLADTVKEAIKVWESHVRTGIHVPFRDSDEASYWQCWPVLTGFSFTARQWGKFVLELPSAADDGNSRASPTATTTVTTTTVTALSGNCQFIDFQQKAFEQLVLDDDKKELIRAVARNAGLASDANDVVADKGGASIFLLHGPPGCGKTLTAEAIAELLHKPLYIVTAGDLGITASEVEKTFGDILELCQQWNALLLIDEADVFLEARTSLEIQRNALVCVMLRLLEYYSGCLFLSSNRSAANIDPAIASRITVLLDYPALTATGRATVWRNLLELVPNKSFATAECDNLTKSCDRLGGKYEMNGRQIKNSIVLARALARERNNADVTMELLERAVAAVAGPAAAADRSSS